MKVAFLKRRYFTRTHHHFAEIREATTGRPYVVLDQSRRQGGRWESQKIVLFQEEIGGLLELLRFYAEAMQRGDYRASGTWSKPETDEWGEEEGEYVDEADEEYRLLALEMEDLYDEVFDRDNWNRAVEEGWFYADEDQEYEADESD